jgi:hypothetical protein
VSSANSLERTIPTLVNLPRPKRYPPPKCRKPDNRTWIITFPLPRKLSSNPNALSEKR